MSGMDLQQGFPFVRAKIADENGYLNQAWYQFFIAMWNRTGGPSGVIPGPPPPPPPPPGPADGGIALDSVFADLVSVPSNSSAEPLFAPIPPPPLPGILLAEALFQEIGFQPQSGNWTPVDASGAGLTLTDGGSSWIQLGKLVVAFLGVTYPVTVDVTSILIGGLPFTAQASVRSGGGSPSFTNSSLPLLMSVAAGSKTLTFTNSGGSLYTNANLSGFQVWGPLIYRMD